MKRRRRQNQNPTRALAAGALFVAFLAFGVWLGYGQISTPGVPAGFVEKTVALDEMPDGASSVPDLNMMLSHLQIMAKQPHVAGSPAQAEVNAYLVDQLTKMGYQPQVERYSLTPEEIRAIDDTHKSPSYWSEEQIRDYANMGDKPTLDLLNVLVKLDAPDTEKGVLIISQYDSVKFGPGAGDDLLSATALMESLRTTGKQVSLKNDVYILFTDGEEQGLLGAACFVKAHPELKDKLQFVMNMECRGNQGSMLMFETTENNLELIRRYREMMTDPVSFSIATQVYHLMDNDTDLTEFMLAGYPGLNFATIEGADCYHGPTDTFENINRGTAAHYLRTIDDAVRYAAAADIEAVSSNQDAVFFPLLRGNLVVLPGTAALVLAIAAAALSAAFLVFALLSRRVRGRDVLKALGAQVGAMAASGLVGFVTVQICAWITGPKTSREYLAWEPAMPLFFVLLAVGVALTVGAVLFMGRRLRSPLAVLCGVMPLPALLSLATALVFNAASYLFSLPVFALLVLALFALFLENSRVFVWIGAVGYAVTALLVLLLFTPIVYLLYVAMAFSVTPAAVALAAIPVSVLTAAFCMVGARPKEAGLKVRLV